MPDKSPGNRLVRLDHSPKEGKVFREDHHTFPRHDRNPVHQARAPTREPRRLHPKDRLPAEGCSAKEDHAKELEDYISESDQGAPTSPARVFGDKLSEDRSPRHPSRDSIAYNRHSR